MLLVIHNLPYNIKYTEIKSLLQEKCGLTQVILDNLVSEGMMKKVTVGLADDGDAAILVRKINGLYLQGTQLYVEDVRSKPASEQPYRASKSILQERDRNEYLSKNSHYEEQIIHRGFQAIPGLQTTPRSQDKQQGMEMSMGYQDSNQMHSGMLGTADPMTMMNYMPVGNMYVPAMPVAQNPLGFGVHQQQMAPLIHQVPEQASFQPLQNEPQGNRSRWDEVGKGNNRERLGNSNQVRRRSPSPGRGQRQDSYSQWNQDAHTTSRWDQSQELQIPSDNMRQGANKRPHNDQMQFDRSSDRQRQSFPSNAQFDRFESSSADSSARNAAPGRELDFNRRIEGRNNTRVPPKRRRKWEFEPEAKRMASSRSNNEDWRTPNPINMSNSEALPYKDNRTLLSSQNREPWQGSIRHKNSSQTSNVWREAVMPNFGQTREETNISSSSVDAKKVLWSQSVVRVVPKQGPPSSYTAKHNIQKEPYPKASYKGRNENSFNAPKTDSNNVSLERQVQKSETWRGQTTAAIVKEMAKNLNIQYKLTEPLMVNLKLSVRSRINVLMGDKIHLRPDEIESMYRAKFPASGDKKLYETVLKTTNNDLQKEKSANNPGQAKDMGEMKPDTPAPTPAAKATENKAVAKVKKQVDKPSPQELAAKIMAAKLPKNNKLGPNAKKTLPNHPGANKSVFNDTKKLEKMEMAEGADIYELPPVLKKALDESADTLCDLFMGECLEPADEKEKIICEEISDVAADEFRKVARLQITKRLLNITTGLSVMIHCAGKFNIQTLENFLKRYHIVSLKKSARSTSKVYVVTCSTYEGFDALCALGSKTLGDLKITIKPRIPTGQKSQRRGGGRKKFNDRDRSDETLLQMPKPENKATDKRQGDSETSNKCTQNNDDVQIVSIQSEEIHTVSDDEVINEKIKTLEAPQIEGSEVVEDEDNREIIAEDDTEDFGYNIDDIDENDLEDY